MDYWLYFWAAGQPDPAAEIAARLPGGDWQCLPACAGVPDFRRDLIASDPDWTALRLLPRPGSGEPADRYLALAFDGPPAADRLRDLRYVAARNQLTMYDAQAG